MAHRATTHLPRRIEMTTSRAVMLGVLLGLILILGHLVISAFFPPRSLDDLLRRCDRHLLSLMEQLARDDPPDASKQVSVAMAALALDLAQTGYLPRPATNNQPHQWIDDINRVWILPNHFSLIWLHQEEQRVVVLARCLDHRTAKLPGGLTMPVHLLGRNRYASRLSWGNRTGATFARGKPEIVICRANLAAWVASGGSLPPPDISARFQTPSWHVLKTAAAGRDTRTLTKFFLIHLAKRYWQTRQLAKNEKWEEAVTNDLTELAIAHEISHIRYPRVNRELASEILPVLAECQAAPPSYLALFQLCHHMPGSTHNPLPNSVLYRLALVFLVDATARDPVFARRSPAEIADYLKQNHQRPWHEITAFYPGLFALLSIARDQEIKKIARNAETRAVHDLVTP